ncbi:halocyanin domain-containing protein [Halomicroarcula sp. F13]|uniref:Halocyanin domain-containing protein n=1 Tax=Haloarcula rubra TaxID=2487747 RepID=A0AAW4PQT7_9EURY|nr:halocyanin domain-containing protein [Halomicroarcula rubra]MBX0323034.1 halocyanin domain-containing protein [Halomicroarcula rubra]
MEPPSTRRQFLASTALTGLAATAGCLSTGETSQAVGDASDGGSTESTETAELTPPDSLGEWLVDANGYDGEPHRYGAGSRPSVWVGEPTDDGLAFAPPVVEVVPMTKVRWDWTGHGGQHNVVALDGTFDSGRTNAQSGTCYQYLFEEPGTYPYVSEPRRDDGMKGAVVVREPPSTGYPKVDQWLSHASNFDGTVVDRTGSDTAVVTVGAEGNGGAFAFDPPLVKIARGSTVRWEWTGDGGAHNVVFEEADVSSGDVASDAGTTFEHTFDDPGQYRYACLPHEALGMRGAVVVE